MEPAESEQLTLFDPFPYMTPEASLLWALESVKMPDEPISGGFNGCPIPGCWCQTQL